MNHRLTENVKLLQKVALFHEDKVLLIKRSPQEDPRPNCWDLPGGNSEWPVNSSQATGNRYQSTGLHIQDAIREVREETSIELSTSNFTTSNLSYVETHFDAEKQLYSICFGWQLHLDNKPEVKISHEHSEYIWVNVNEVANYDFGAIGEWIKEVIRG